MHPSGSRLASGKRERRQRRNKKAEGANAGASRCGERLPLGVPLSHREVSSEFLRRAAWAVTGRTALDAPRFLQRPSVDCVEAELVEQIVTAYRLAAAALERLRTEAEDCPA